MTELQPNDERPMLRHLDTHEVEQDGQPGIVLTDPVGLARGQIFIPEPLLPIVARLDGTRTAAAIQDELERELGDAVPADFVAGLVRDLDEALVLHSPRFQDELDRQVAEFEAAPRRPASHAGSAGYPTDPEACHRALDDILGPIPSRSQVVRGLVAPHIDLARGRDGYRAAYAALAASQPADLYVVFGTGHQGPKNTITGLPIDWETPLGSLRTDRAFVATVHEIWGPSEPLDLFLHRGEHSIEFQMLFLAHVLRDHEFEVAGFLTGSMPRESGERDRLLDALRSTAEASGKRVCWIAGADLAHLGPFFGDPAPTDPTLLERLERDERGHLAHLERGAAFEFFDSVHRDGNRDRICGSTPITLAAALADSRGELLHYGQANHADGSQVVSFCSMRFCGD